MLIRARCMLAAALLLVFVVTSSLTTAYAYVGSCSASSSPNGVEPGSTTFQFTVTNSGDTAINWMKITRPSANFVITGSNSPGWTSSNDQTYAYASDSTLDPGASTVVNVNAQIANQLAGAAYWTVETSDDDGTSSTACGGVLDASIGASSIPPNIYNVSLSNLKMTSITILWTTDKPATSQVNYGADSSYGSSTTIDSALTTSHSVDITDLSARTAYHYRVVSDDGNGNVGTSSDNTFVTPSTDPETTAPTVSGANPLTKTLSNFGVAIKAIPTEHTPPTISLTTDFTKPFKQAPTVTGTAQDNEALAVIEYSTDGGKNWLPVDSTKGIGTKAATFSLTPIGLDDGNYALLARAIDTSANMGVTAVSTLVIDRLEPWVGGTVLSLGPQILSPAADGSVLSMVGVDQKITLSAVGGPTTIMLSAQQADTHLKPQAFGLTKSADTGLWSGVMSFASPGEYNLVAHAVDGAGNTTTQVIRQIHVASPAHTIDQKTKRAVASTVTVYYSEPDSHNWVVWDGAGYGENNPQATNKQGNFELFLPPGTYYVKAQAPGYETLITSIFETDQSSPLTSVLAMKPLRTLGIGPLRLSLPLFAVQKIGLSTEQLNQSRTAGKASGETTAQGSLSAKLIGKPAPNFTLKDTTGATVHTADLLGRPTLLSFGTTWSPTASEQLTSLSQLQTDKDINILPIALQEGAAKVRAYSAIGHMNLRWLFDPDSTLSSAYGAPNLPTYYFLDRKGIVRNVVTGVLTQPEILNILRGY